MVAEQRFGEPLRGRDSQKVQMDAKHRGARALEIAEELTLPFPTVKTFIFDTIASCSSPLPPFVIFARMNTLRGGMQVHAVPESERAFDASGKRLPWGYEFAE